MVGSATLTHNGAFLRRLALTRSALVRRGLIAHASRSELLAIVEIALNILKFRVPLRAVHRRPLVANAAFVRRLARQRTEKSVRATLLKADEETIRALLRPILSYIPT